MNIILPETQGDFVAIQVSGKLDESDYQQLVPLLKARIAEHGKIALYWEMKNFEGWKLSGLWADLKFDVKHAKDFTRVAIVGEKKNHHLIEAVIKPFTSARVKYYDLTQREDAIAWAQGLSDTP